MSSINATGSAGRSELCFALAAIVFVTVTFLLTAMAPLVVSVVAVFLFAGPHNYAEARYFLTRLPAKLGRLKSYFVLSAFGIITLTVALPMLARIPGWLNWPSDVTVWLLGLWNTMLLLWCTALVWMRSHQPPRRDWDYALPLGFGIAGLFWLQPVVLPLILVYLHPLMGLWILDRELRKSRPEWQRAFRFCSLLLPVFLLQLWRVTGETTNDGLLVSASIREQIAQHSGSRFFTEITGRRLIAIHAFLELLHYGVWLVAVPTVSGRVFSKAFSQIPLMKRPALVRTVIKSVLAGSAVLVVVLWLSFIADYQSTRDIYFTFATLHVLAEVPFLLRLL